MQVVDQQPQPKKFDQVHIQRSERIRSSLSEAANATTQDTHQEPKKF